MCTHVKSPASNPVTCTILALSAVGRNVALFVTPHKGENVAHSDVTSQKLSFPRLHDTETVFLKVFTLAGVFQKLSLQ